MNKIVELELRSTIESGPIVLRAKELKQLLAVVRAARVHAEGPHNGNNLELLRQTLAALEEGEG